MKTRFLLGLFLLAGLNLSAEPVSRKQAFKEAQQFLASKGVTLSSATVSHSAKSRIKASDSNYYVFNADNGNGYVIVSGDDRTAPILGYVDMAASTTTLL